MRARFRRHLVATFVAALGLTAPSLALAAPASAAAGCWMQVNWVKVDGKVRAKPTVVCGSYPYYDVQAGYTLFRNTTWGPSKEKSWFKLDGPGRMPRAAMRNPRRAQTFCVVYNLQVANGTRAPYESTGRNCIRT